LPAATDQKTLQSLDALNLRIGEALKKAPAHEPAGAAKVAIDAQGEKMRTREQEARPKSVTDQIAELGGEDKIVKLGFPKKELGYLLEDDKLAFLKGDIDLDEAKSRANI
jgi:hypothetical protein